jgi:peptide/nickel transport system substrate-binding protein
VFAFPELSYTYIGWNLRSVSTPALADKRVRQALAYGLDMDAFIQQALYGQATRVFQHHPTASWAAADITTLQRYPFDRRKAEDLLRSAGYVYGPDGYYQRDGKPLELTIVTNSGNKARETLLQTAIEEYRRIGVKVNPRLMPFDSMLSALSMRSEDVSGWIVGWKLNVEPDPYGIWHSSAIPDAEKRAPGFNFGAFSSADADRLITAARTPATPDCSVATRRKSYEALNRLLNDEQPYDFAFSPNVLLATSKDLRGFEPGTFSMYAGIERWWLSR